MIRNENSLILEPRSDVLQQSVNFVLLKSINFRPVFQKVANLK